MARLWLVSDLFAVFTSSTNIYLLGCVAGWAQGAEPDGRSDYFMFAA